MPNEPREVREGDLITADMFNDLRDEQRRWRKARGDNSVIVDFADSLSSPPLFRLANPPSPPFYIRLTGIADATFGGYPWVRVQRRWPLVITNRGHDYTTATVSFSVTGTGATAPTATVDVLANGTLARPNVITPGAKMTACSATISGDGADATLACLLDQGQLIAGGWVDAEQVGAVGPDDTFGHPTPGDLAYEVDGVLGLAADGAVYSAVRDGGTGQLLFFSSRTYLAKTYTITTYPTGASAWFACHPVLISGIPVEGGTPSLADSSASMLAYNLGTTLPPVGTYVKISEINGATGPYFVMRYT